MTQRTGPTPPPEEVKSCCAAAYSSDAATAILGGHYHPGGTALTRRLADRLALRAGERVLDVAAGPGTTAFLLADEYGASVDGVDLGAATVAKARASAEATGTCDSVRFHLGDAERLPFDDAGFDVLVCECAFCTFPDKATAAREFARVPRPGGRVGITDITLQPERLDGRLRGLTGWIACLADARPVDDYRELLADAGLHARVVERHDGALATMIDQIEARLRAFRIAHVDVGTALELTALARDAVARGDAGYVLLTADKPAP
ncbi:MAG: methyltransferase domain-containing protein [Streptosporangiales bacterium]|nr:methyltransferase domain-containing protein [Streptosporangiales bacterium]